MTTDAWPKEVFGIPVVADPIGTAGALLKPVSIVLHTTEGPEDGDPRPTFKARGDAPHFAVSAKDGGTIWQLRSLDEWAAALRHGTLPPGAVSPNAHAVQIEICGFTGGGNGPTAQWSLSPLMLRLTAACVAYMSQHHLIDLRVPCPGWLDDCSDMPLPWAANNSRRKWAEQHGRWPASEGVWEHVEVPWQDPTWHYDCGALERTAIIDAAKALLAPPPGGDDDLTPEQEKQLAHVERGLVNVTKVMEQIYRRSGQAPPLPTPFDPMGEWPKGTLDKVAQEIVK